MRFQVTNQWNPSFIINSVVFAKFLHERKKKVSERKFIFEESIFKSCITIIAIYTQCVVLYCTVLLQILFCCKRYLVMKKKFLKPFTSHFLTKICSSWCVLKPWASHTTQGPECFVMAVVRNKLQNTKHVTN